MEFAGPSGVNGGLRNGRSQVDAKKTDRGVAGVIKG